MGLRILHTADWHMDAPLTSFSEERRAVLRRAQLAIPEKTAQLCRRENCDLVLLAGDIFDGEASRETVDALKKDGRVSLCVYDQGYRKEGEWAYNVKSVIVFGKIEIIDDIDAVRAICEPLCRKFTSDEGYIKKELAESAKNTLLLKLTPEHICGKLVNEA